jgi:hypothetical protein
MASKASTEQQQPFERTFLAVTEEQRLANRLELLERVRAEVMAGRVKSFVVVMCGAEGECVASVVRGEDFWQLRTAGLAQYVQHLAEGAQALRTAHSGERAG